MSKPIDWDRVIADAYDRGRTYDQYMAVPGHEIMSRGHYNAVRRSTGFDWQTIAEDLAAALAADARAKGIARQSKQSILAEAHRAAVEASIMEITLELASVLGPRTTGIVGGYKGSNSVYRWLDGAVPKALDGARERRLRLAYEIVTILGKQGYSRAQIATWLGAVHPALGVTPAYAIKGGQYASVIAAVVGDYRPVQGPQAHAVAV